VCQSGKSRAKARKDVGIPPRQRFGSPPPSPGLSGLDRPTIARVEPPRRARPNCQRGPTRFRFRFGSKTIADGLKLLIMLEICMNWARLNRSPTGRKQPLDDLVGCQAGMKSPCPRPSHVQTNNVSAPCRSLGWAVAEPGFLRRSGSRSRRGPRRSRKRTRLCSFLRTHRVCRSRMLVAVSLLLPSPV
jgi:hypothetical protein